MTHHDGCPLRAYLHDLKRYHADEEGHVTDTDRIRCALDIYGSLDRIDGEVAEHLEERALIVDCGTHYAIAGETCQRCEHERERVEVAEMVGRLRGLASRVASVS